MNENTFERNDDMDWYPRENYLKKIRDFYHATDIIKVITGVRRCGKSCLMETIAYELKESGIPAEKIQKHRNVQRKQTLTVKRKNKLSAF